MAQLAESEAVIWRQAEQIRTLRTALLEMQKMLVTVARRQGGILVIDPAELATVPSGALLRRVDRPDGRVLIRVDYGGQDEPGQPGQQG